MGGGNLDKIEGDIDLTFARPDEPTVKLLGESDERAPYAGEVIYRDRIGAICRRWNWKEADRTKLTIETRNAVLVVEALPPMDAKLVTEVIEELAEMVARHCGGTVRTSLLDRTATSARLSP